MDGEVQVRIPCWSRSRMAIQLREGSLVGRHFERMVKSKMLKKDSMVSKTEVAKMNC